MPTLKTSFVGLTLPSPLIAGSAAITKDLDQMRRAEDAGAGAVIMKGFSDIEAMRKSPAPRYRVIEHEMADRDAFTFYSYEQASHFDIHDYAAEVARTVEALSIPVIPNIDCQCVESWLEATRIVAQAGPAAIEANVSCPHGSIAFSGQDVERRILEVVEELRRAIDLPLIIKLTPQLTSPMSFVKAIEEIGAEGVTMFNRFTGLEVDVETGRPVMHGGYAGHGGPWARNFVLRWVNTVSPGTDLQISASGGVSEAEHALAYIMAGAQTVQVCTGIYLEGFEILTRLNAQLLEFMEARGLETLDEIRGELTERITPLDQVDRRHLVVADIQPRGTAPCRWECPINEDAQGYLNLIAEGKYDHALRLIKQNHPFPGVLGRCCHHPCETACTRGEVDDPISIAAMKRFAADHGGRYLPETPEPPPWRDERVAIVGAGPGGLTAAYRLALMGYRSTVFERLPVAGGMLAVGIPEYRLPRDVVRHEIGEIEGLGVEIRTGVSVGRDVSLDDLREQGYSAILLAVGGHRQRKLGIPGEQLEGVIDGVRLLREHALGEPVALGEHVVVIGGGDVAVDSARVSIRLIDRVTLAYRRRFEDMPARREEIEEALEEGVELVDQLQPVEIINEGGRVAGVRFARTRMTQPGPDGRVGFEEIEGSSEIIECDTVVVSVGQIPDIGWLKSVGLDRLCEGDRVLADADSGATCELDIFACGDCVTGSGPLVEAMAAGKRAAFTIAGFLQGEEVPRPEPAMERVEPEQVIRESQPIVLTRRQRMPVRPAEERVTDFGEVALGLPEELGRAEAVRCMDCGRCSNCGDCVRVCPWRAIERVDDVTRVDPEVCDSCGLCYLICPQCAIELVEREEPA
ncbi:MAG: FAD-dependent oxidoreductase [candidate division WS1 bacterium]|nr:FAD-dependent oxidoreductase [candidate division WS1 bacterium]